MAQITLDVSNAALTRIQAATAAWNAQKGSSLTPKQFCIMVLRDSLRGIFERVELETATQTAKTAIDNDLKGIS